MPQLLIEMRHDLAQHPLCREFVLLKRNWIYWAKGNELCYYFDDHPNLLSQIQILENYGWVHGSHTTTSSDILCRKSSLSTLANDSYLPPNTYKAAGI